MDGSRFSRDELEVLYSYFLVSPLASVIASYMLVEYKKFKTNCYIFVLV